MPNKKVYIVMRCCYINGCETHWIFSIYDSSDKATECVKQLNEKDSGCPTANSSYRNYIQEWSVN